MKRLNASLLIIVMFMLASVALSQSYTPFTVSDLLKVRRVSDPQVSPDGRRVAYAIADVNKDANRNITQIYLVSIDGGEPKQLTSGNSSSTGPRWSPDGKRIAFTTGGQIWTMDADGGNRKQVTNISTGASDPVWSPDGRYMIFVSDVYPECQTEECNAQREKQANESKVKAKIADRLLYRHWTAFKEGKRTHIFVVQVETGKAIDITPGDYDSPPFNLGGPTDYAFSPDGNYVVFARNTDKVEATSTNNDIFIVPILGGEPLRITGSNKGSDQSPQYSPDGHYIAYRSQQTAGFESDRWRLMLYDTQTRQSRSLTDKFDLAVESFIFSPDGKRIYFSAAERGQQPIYSIATIGGEIKKVIADGFNDDVKITNDGRTLVFSRNSASKPTEIYRASADGAGVTQLTKTNDALMAQYNLKPAEEVTWLGAGGTKVSGYIMKPANFNASQKWPLIVLIHGGPQGAWNDNWGYRWNPQVFASAGYVVFTPNPRGSTGYGQQFVNEISGDWGGKAYTDIMNGVAHVLSLGYVDKERIGAAGGSYGGYMVDWIEGHNNDPRFQFKALVSHAGVYDLVSMYGATEELWFPEWEFKGTPWDNPEMYARWSPNMFVKNFKTPLLVTHGEIDYRVPVTQGLELFTALQKMGVESKLLYFPDEGHWILKPQNSELWYKTVIGWFDAHLKPNAQPSSSAMK